MTDKPAAAGSGEPCAECGVPRELHDDPKQYIAPPSSQPTVTLDREHYDEFIAAAQQMLDYPNSVASRIRLTSVLALLRASETQPKQD